MARTRAKVSDESQRLRAWADQWLGAKAVRKEEDGGTTIGLVTAVDVADGQVLWCGHWFHPERDGLELLGV